MMAETLPTVGDKLCSGRKKPSEKKTCKRQPCPYTWQAGDWSQVRLSNQLCFFWLVRRMIRLDDDLGQIG